MLLIHGEVEVAKGYQSINIHIRILSMNDTDKEDKICGLIMPIASMEGTPYSKEFWNNVRQFLAEAVNDAGFELVPAWEDENFGVIHARIIENIKTIRVMIGVIIGHNPNVMLECGMRIWTDLPILLIGEEGAIIPFDIKPLECLGYPTDREYSKMCKLKQDIATKLKAMVSPDYHAFKSHFNVEAEEDKDLKVSKIKISQFMIDTSNEINSLKAKMEKVVAEVENSNRYKGFSHMSVDDRYMSAISNAYANYKAATAQQLSNDVSPIVAAATDKAAKEK